MINMRDFDYMVNPKQGLKKAFVLMVISIILFLCVTFFFINNKLNYKTTTATVSYVNWEYATDNDLPIYRVRVDFEVGNTKYEDVSLSHKFNIPKEVGDTIDIIYNTKNPTDINLARNNNPLIYITCYVVVLIAFAVSVKLLKNELSFDSELEKLQSEGISVRLPVVDVVFHKGFMNIYFEYDGDKYDSGTIKANREVTVGDSFNVYFDREEQHLLKIKQIKKMKKFYIDVTTYKKGEVISNGN